MTAQTHAPSLVYVVSEDWYFLSHRLPMARAARDAGYIVHVATRVTDGAERIRAEGFELHAIPFSRGCLSPFDALKTIRALREVHRSIRPDLIHHVAVEPTVLGSIAALGLPAARLNALTGLGFIFSSTSARAGFLKFTIKLLLRLLLNRAKNLALVQNLDDLEILQSIGVPRSKISIIPGSGVDTDRFPPLPEPAGPVTIAFVGRLLASKGIRALIEAFRIVRNARGNTQLLIAGTPDPSNPTSISPDEVRSWTAEAGVTWLGHVSDVAALWARAHIAALPSHREGLPLSLLEAAACGRPLVATDVPGCREIVFQNKTGLLVPVDDPTALAEAIIRLVDASELRSQFGATARQLVVDKFSARLIGEKVVKLYNVMIAQGARTRPRSV